MVSGSQSEDIKKVAKNMNSALGSKLSFFALYNCVILSMKDNIIMIENMIDKTEVAVFYQCSW